MNEYLGQYQLFLNNLIFKEVKQNDMNVIYNKVQFQSKADGIATCGRHVINRLLCMIHYNMNLKQYIDFMKQSKQKTNFSFDEIVSTIIS